MTPLLITSALLVSYSCFVAAQNECQVKNGIKESCVVIQQCDSLMKLLENRTPENQALLRQAFCGFSGNSPKVCCPSLSCLTPEGTQGTCGSLTSCAHIVSMLQTTPVPQSTIDYVKSLRCGGPDALSICCGPPRPTVQPTPNTSPRPTNGKCALSAIPPDPSTECCGVDSGGGGNRIFGGNATAVDEYPWLAVIEYEKNHKIKLLCGGVLISGRYVMTASHCVTGPVLNVGRPVNVRLGEYDTSKSGPDCVEVEGGGTDCTDGEITVPIEQTIAHPEYNPSSKLRRHDIALIRLDRVVAYTDFIRPICLPTIDFTETPQTNLELFVAGWGAVSDVQSSSNIKLAVTLPYLSYQDCQPSYSVPNRRVQLWDGQICAGGVIGKDSCKGDSGGPLLRANGKLMELVGIVSFGPTPCGMENVAGVYTKVYKYLPWIRSQIVE